MASQVQCPECGELKVSRKTVTIDQNTGKPVMDLLFVLLVGIFGSIAGVGVVWAGIYGGSLYYLLMGLPLLYLGLSMPIKYFRADKVKLFKYKCNGCGHRWERRAD
jgi:predicted RNA-binding Zn-ribbon protein involved in translation (DUF1610 family)